MAGAGSTGRGGGVRHPVGPAVTPLLQPAVHLAERAFLVERRAMCSRLLVEPDVLRIVTLAPITTFLETVAALGGPQRLQQSTRAQIRAFERRIEEFLSEYAVELRAVPNTGRPRRGSVPALGIPPTNLGRADTASSSSRAVGIALRRATQRAELALHAEGRFAPDRRTLGVWHLGQVAVAPLRTFIDLVGAASGAFTNPWAAAHLARGRLYEHLAAYAESLPAARLASGAADDCRANALHAYACAHFAAPNPRLARVAGAQFAAVARMNPSLKGRAEAAFAQIRAELGTPPSEVESTLLN